MSTKRKSNLAPDSNASKKHQLGSLHSKNNIEVEEHYPLLQQDYILDLEQEFDRFCMNWGSKCSESSNYELRDPTKSDVHLDGYGMNIVTSFRKAAQIAVSIGRVLDPKFLEMLVLVLRCDVVLAHNHASYGAYAALMWYLEQHPYATIKYKTTDNDTDASPTPYISLSPFAAWTPLESSNNRDSFTSKYLLVPDISISGRNFKLTKEGKAQKRRSDNKWGSALDMIAHCIEKGALQSATMDLNGDLLLLHYLLAVIEQDLNARLKVFDELKEIEGSSMVDESDGSVEQQRKDLLEHSIAWKIFADSYVSAEQHKQFIYNLVRLIVGDDIDDNINQVEDEPEDDAPASACVFTSRELSALGSRLLNIQMRLFGAAEGAGFFLATSRHRSSSINYRMALDSNILNAFWNEKGVCKRPEAARLLLRSLCPRDALRVLGLLTAHKFACTYDATSLGTFGKKIKDLTVLHDARSMLDRGSDISSFFEVDMVPVVSSFHREPQRVLKTYKTIDHLAVVMASIACAMHALLSNREKVPCGDGGMKKFCEEMKESIQAIVGLANEAKSESSVLSELGNHELIIAQMTLNMMTMEV